MLLRRVFITENFVRFSRLNATLIKQRADSNRLNALRHFNVGASFACKQMDVNAENSQPPLENEEKDRPRNVSQAASPCIDDLERLQGEFLLLQKEVDGLKGKYEASVDKYKRALADGENMRLRMQRQIEDTKTFAIQSFCKDLIAVADTLELATASVQKKEEFLQKNELVKSMHDGLSNTLAQLLQVFQSHHLSQLKPAEGEKFDPNFHEALFEVADASKAPGTIAHLQKIGYALQNRCIRPAAVAIFRSP